MKKIIIIILISYALFSCKSVPDFNNKNSIINDTLSIKNINGEIVSGINKSNPLIFSKIGQEYKFKNGEDVQLIISGIDMEDATFDIITDNLTKDVTIKLVDKRNSKVVFTKKCQTINRYNVESLPSIQINKNLPVEQVIFTPIFDDNCNLIGFQMRYGSQERGCNDSITNEIYRKFIFCTDKDSYNYNNNNFFDDIKSENKSNDNNIKSEIPKTQKPQTESRKSKLRKMGFPVK